MKRAVHIPELALQMQALNAHLATHEEHGGVRIEFNGPPYGRALLTIDPASSAPAASFNRNRVSVCGTAGGLTKAGFLEMLDRFDAHGVNRRFVWLSPGPEIATVRQWLGSLSFSQVEWTRYPTMVFEGATQATTPTPFELRCVTANELTRIGHALGDSLFAGYSRTIGKPGFRHYLAFDNELPIAAAALLKFGEIGYLTYAGTVPEHRRRGAQSALIARRVADAQAMGCTCIVSQTLTMLSDSLANLQRAGFREAYEQEVYEYRRD